VIDAVEMVRGCVINDAEDDTSASARPGILESWIISAVKVAVPNNCFMLNELILEEEEKKLEEPSKRKKKWKK
jgi:hypothetical protein